MSKQDFDIQLHKQFLTKLLLYIFKEINSKIGFKGGTCAFLFYDLPRVSLDLDFDILESLVQKDIDNLKKIFAKHLAIKDFYDKKWTTFFLLDYQSYAPNIKIEFNKRKWQSAVYIPFWFMGVEMKIVDKATLLAGKLLALRNRRQPVPRDLFDVYYFLQRGFPINEAFIKEVSGRNLKNYLQSLPSFIDKHFNSKNVLQGLGQVLDDKQKKWAKTELISEAKEAIKKQIEKAS